MKIKVNEQSQRFYLAFEKWESAVGHEIKVGQYRFCAIPLSESINISEVTSGVNAINIPMSLEIRMVTATKEETMKFFEKVGERLKRIIESTKDFDDRLQKMKKTAFERLGEMPPIENVDIDWIFEKESEIVH
ncbi:hypothetical protein CON65_02500 [Bacillus pseudomycoides]|uniref:Uncharacterized protein n=1 Tax=Bacillus pseudomycoides TaxID=64104 RepID=A0AA91ZV39_9BACI|nr:MULTISPECIES: hypothetical protein [Bacillus]PED84324.1 hypothetical protein CON65_02500 [Bacillus pseudomycoides]PEU15851.1 hypothetical protein CN524_06205 [Bacillus sp. AFS019443]PFW64849.1 hypothetical protein COL20_02355 [Bacillus sp. AFS075034]